MSFKEEQFGKYNMANRSNLIVPEDAFLAETAKYKQQLEIEETTKRLKQLAKDKQDELNKRMETLEMLPMFNKIILLPYPENPYKTVLNGSIIVEYDGAFMNPDSGEKDKLQVMVGCAKVIEIGPDCKYLKCGDDVFYDLRTVFPVPFLGLGYRLTSEPQILCVLNEKLKERFNM